MDNNPSFKLDSIDFEGPLSLILLLLQKNKIEIRDINVSEILDQYTEYLAKMQELDLEVASEFVRMAAYLLYIKTSSLLNTEDEVSELEILIESLEQLQAKETLSQVAQVTAMLNEAYRQGVLYGAKGPEPLPKGSGDYAFTHTSVELLEALFSALSNTKQPVEDAGRLTEAIPHQVVYSVRNKSRQILSRLRLRDISLNELYSECATKSEIVATFVSVLELCSSGSIIITVSSSGDGYDLSFAGGNIEEIIEKIEE